MVLTSNLGLGNLILIFDRLIIPMLLKFDSGGLVLRDSITIRMSKKKKRISITAFNFVVAYEKAAFRFLNQEKWV